MAEEKRPPRHVTMQEQEPALTRAALCVLVARAGGSIEYTQSEYAAIRDELGEFVIRTEIDKSGHGEPVIRVRLEPSNRKGSMPVS